MVLLMLKYSKKAYVYPYSVVLCRYKMTKIDTQQPRDHQQGFTVLEVVVVILVVMVLIGIVLLA